MKTTTTLYLVPPKGNVRRKYGLRFKLNGQFVTAPIVARSGDRVSVEYLGGNIAQNPEALAAWNQLKELTNGQIRFGGPEVTLP